MLNWLPTVDFPIASVQKEDLQQIGKEGDNQNNSNHLCIEAGSSRVLFQTHGHYKAYTSGIFFLPRIVLNVVSSTQMVDYLISRERSYFFDFRL